MTFNAVWKSKMEEVGPDGLTGYQRRGLAIKAAKLAKNPEYFQEWSDKVMSTLGKEGLQKRARKINQTRLSRSKLPAEKLAYRVFRNRVSYLSRSQDLSSLENYDKWKITHELDHKYSVHDGYREGARPEILAAKENLQFIPITQNRRKNKKSSITLEQLMGELSS